MIKHFVSKIFLFAFIIFCFLILGFLLPTTPRDKQSLLFSQKIKDSLLVNTFLPRIILIGGSNVSMGINSNILKKELKLNPINTSIHASIGLNYMMDHTLKYVKSGDIIIISPEYHQFYDNVANGRDELLRIVANLNKKEFFDLRTSQLINIYKYFPSFCLSKFKIQEYFYNRKELVLYGSDGYNKYGDYSKHWDLKPSPAPIDISIGHSYNRSIIHSIKEFERAIKLKGALLYITFPGYQSSSFEKHEREINYIYNNLKKEKFNILGTPLKYKMPDDIMYGTTYHLSKKGLDLRTILLVTDIKNHQFSKK
jgi:hypothetical protein